VLCYSCNDGYSFFSFIRASAVVKYQSTLTSLPFCFSAHANANCQFSGLLCRKDFGNSFPDFSGSYFVYSSHKFFAETTSDPGGLRNFIRADKVSEIAKINTKLLKILSKSSLFFLFLEKIGTFSKNYRRFWLKNRRKPKNTYLPQ